MGRIELRFCFRGKFFRKLVARMSRTVETHFLPDQFDPGQLRGGWAVVIDVLRASTTIVHALECGAVSVMPCETVEEARHLKAAASDRPLLGGERGGQMIDGFDLGNSPAGYSREVVGGRRVIFTTTNGTRALLRSRAAEHVLIGAFVNLSAVVLRLSRDAAPVHLVCAGSDGQLSLEDVLFAGAVVARLVDAGDAIQIDEQSQLAMDHFRVHGGSTESLLHSLRVSRGGRHLQSLGMDSDIQLAGQIDLFDRVPEFLPQSGQVS